MSKRTNDEDSRINYITWARAAKNKKGKRTPMRPNPMDINIENN
jgi:hypothetical protein